MGNPMDWVDEIAKEKEEEQEKGYFKFQEGDNRIQLLTHAAPLAQRWTGSKYEVIVDGESQEGKSIKGVCYVLQDNEIKLAFLPYTVVKAIRELQNDEDWAFQSFPMPRAINIKTKGAGTKEVEYSVIPSPKESEVPQTIMDELAKKKSPEDIIQAMKEKKTGKTVEPAQKTKYDTKEADDIADSIPF